MRRLIVYYDTNANICVSIDGMHPVDPKTANELLIKGEVQAALLQKQRYDPVGIFSRTGASYTFVGSDGKKLLFMYGEANIPPIDYGTISPEDLQNRLQSRLLSIRDYLRDPNIEIECIRGVPPGGYQISGGKFDDITEDLTIEDLNRSIKIGNPGTGQAITIKDKRLVGPLEVVMRDNKNAGFKGSLNGEGYKISRETEDSLRITLDDSFVIVKDADVGKLYSAIAIRVKD